MAGHILAHQHPGLIHQDTLADLHIPLGKLLPCPTHGDIHADRPQHAFLQLLDVEGNDRRLFDILEFRGCLAVEQAINAVLGEHPERVHDRDQAFVALDFRDFLQLRQQVRNLRHHFLPSVMGKCGIGNRCGMVINRLGVFSNAKIGVDRINGIGQ